MLKVTFQGIETTLAYKTYNNGRLAILLTTKTGEIYAKVTTNLPEIPLGDNEILIKDYSENEGMMDAFVEEGLVEKVISFGGKDPEFGQITSDYGAKIWVARMTPKLLIEAQGIGGNKLQ
jgi:hypothetical protein